MYVSALSVAVTLKRHKSKTHKCLITNTKIMDKRGLPVNSFTSQSCTFCCIEIALLNYQLVCAITMHIRPVNPIAGEHFSSWESHRIRKEISNNFYLNQVLK